MILILISIILIIIDNELEFRSSERDNTSLTNFLLSVRCVNVLITLILYIIMIIKLKLQNDIFKLSYSSQINKGFTWKELFYICVEVILISIIIPPYFDTFMDYNYFLSYAKRFIAVLCIFKVHPVFDQILLFSPFQNKKVRFLRSILNLDSTCRGSLIQTWFQEHKYISLSLFPFIFFPTASYILMIAERVNHKDYTLELGVCINSDNFYEFIWLTGVSFFTSNKILILVGYGDVVPCSFIGRAVVIFIILCGLIYNSLTINIVSEFLNYESNEISIDEICCDSDFRKNYRIAAFHFIQGILVQFIKYRRSPVKKGFKANFLFKNWKNFTLLSNFKLFRKKYILKFQQNDEMDSDLLFGTYLNVFQDQLDHSLLKLCHISNSFMKKSTSGNNIINLLVSYAIDSSTPVTLRRVQERVVLNCLEQESSNITKLTEDIENIISLFKQRENFVDNEVVHMSQLVQTRVSNMFLNVINNINNK
jgi:hypothetical protein